MHMASEATVALVIREYDNMQSLVIRHMAMRTGMSKLIQHKMIAEMIAAERCCADLMLGISLDGTDPTLPWSACLSVRVMHQTCRWQVADGLLAIGHDEFTPDAS